MIKTAGTRKIPLKAGVTLLAFVLVATGFPTAVQAQELVRRRPWTLFDIFRPEPPRRAIRRDPGNFPSAPRATRPAKKSANAPRVNRAKAAAAAAKPELDAAVTVEKSIDAKKILVIGDFIGSGLSEGLAKAMAADANLVVVDKTNGSSGLVRTDVYDWPKQLPTLIAAEKPAAIVVMLGSNDRQPMKVGDGQQQVGTDAWNKEYDRRATVLAKALEESKLPWLWVGMPAFKSTKMTSDMVAFNDVYKAAAQANKGEFVDIWDGFVDETGAFMGTGPDVSGQPARLRGADGINITKAGKDKVAFYVDKPLRKFLGATRADPAMQTVAAKAVQGPVAAGPTNRTEPMALNGPALDNATELLGGGSPSSRILPAPAPAAVPSGRADDFATGASQ